MNFVILSLLILGVPSFAASPKPGVPAKAPPQAQAAKVLWDEWYTVTVDKKVPYAYYNDRVESKDGKIIFKNSMWKKDDGFINEEQVAAFAKDDADVTPLFFNFHSNYKASETQIDATVRDDGILNVKVRKNGSELPVIKKSIPKRTIFSTMFPVWISRNASTLQPKGSLAFYSILEDNLELAFRPVSGRISLEPQDEFAKSSKATKVKVLHMDLTSYWYLDSKGIPIRIDLKAQNAVAERTTEAQAKKFLTSK